MIKKIKQKKLAKLTFTSKAKQIEKLHYQKPPKKSISKKKNNNDIIKAHLKVIIP